METRPEGSDKPDLIVGVDFGMTCTGVSYALPSLGSNTVKWIQKWPGRAQANENKVPTLLAYPSTTHQLTPCSWGFLAETANPEDKDIKDWFKIYLDPVRLEKEQRRNRQLAPKSIQEVEKWYEDYLALLYRHIEAKLSAQLSTRWYNARVEFIFSVPATWRPVIVDRFHSIATRAGFGNSRNCTLSMGLTEAEAAAIHVSIETPGIFQEKDILLICDAGGGTTDLTVLQVTDTNRETLSLTQLDVVFGETVGSTHIDFDFQSLARKRLEQAATELSLPCEDVAWEMMKSRDFQNAKCEHGSPDETPIFSVPIPKISSDYINHMVGIENGEMHFVKDDLEGLFTKQIKKLIALIDKQLNTMQQKYPNEEVAHLILSGGLGHSPFVQKYLKSHFDHGGSHSNARNIKTGIALDPQLAVCKGLVADRLCKLKAGTSILKWRRCRASYGTLCRERYDKKIHVGRTVVADEITGKPYVTQSVSWFIKKGEPVSTDPITRNFTRKIKRGESRIFPTSIIVSEIDASLLRDYLNQDTTILCDVESDLSSIDVTHFKEKKQHIWRPGKGYFQVDYQIKVLVGPADIRFELYFDGRKINKDNPIKVEWQAAPPPKPTEVAVDDVAVLIGNS